MLRNLEYRTLAFSERFLREHLLTLQVRYSIIVL